VSNNYQSGVLDSSAAGRLALPETVSVALEEIAADMREGLLALAVGTGLQVMAQLMEADVAAVCGPKGKHNPGREAVRHGSEAGSVTLGGRRVPVRRPRMRTADGAAELPVPPDGLPRPPAQQERHNSLNPHRQAAPQILPLLGHEPQA
jgi:putative transposase